MSDHGVSPPEFLHPRLEPLGPLDWSAKGWFVGNEKPDPKSHERIPLDYGQCSDWLREQLSLLWTNQKPRFWWEIQICMRTKDFMVE